MVADHRQSASLKKQGVLLAKSMGVRCG